VTTFGCIAAKDWMPADDATLVKKLKAAGAIILAKSSMPGRCSFQSCRNLNHVNFIIFYVNVHIDVYIMRIYLSCCPLQTGPQAGSPHPPYPA